MTPEDIAAARAMCEAATPGPWVADEMTDYPGAFEVWHTAILEHWGRVARVGPCANIEHTRINAAFIAAARTGWPAALDEVERLRTVVNAVWALEYHRLDTLAAEIMDSRDKRSVAVRADRRARLLQRRDLTRAVRAALAELDAAAEQDG